MEQSKFLDTTVTYQLTPLPMRGSMVMTMVMIPPSRRDDSPAEQLAGALDWFRQVLPRDGGASPRKLPSDFFQGKRLHIAKDGHRRPARWPTRQGGAPRPLPRGWWVAPLWYFLRPIFLIYSKTDFRGVSGLLELCRIGL